MKTGYNTPKSHIPIPFSLPITPPWPSAAEYTMPKAKLNNNTMSDSIPFPFNNFTYFFTLFSKCFSSFLHSTCSLSVSRQYLALEGIYLPLRAAFPNNSTLRKHLTMRIDFTGLSPSKALYSNRL